MHIFFFIFHYFFFHDRKRIEKPVYHLRWGIFRKYLRPFSHWLFFQNFWCFQGVEKGCIENEWTKMFDWILNKLLNVALQYLKNSRPLTESFFRSVELYASNFINSFLANVLILYPLKTPENHRILLFSGGLNRNELKKGTLGLL